MKEIFVFVSNFQVGLKQTKYTHQFTLDTALALIYENVNLEIGYRVDLMVENKFVIKIKSVDALHDIHFAQTLTYLKLSNCKLGMLINFNVVLLKNGVKRVINGTL